MSIHQLLKLLFLGTMVGSSFMLIEIALPTVRPFTIVLAQTSLAGVVLYAFARFRGHRMPPWGSAWGSFFLMGLLNALIPFSLINWGQVVIEAGLGAILHALMPLFTVLFAHFATHDERFSGRKLAGVLVGLAGVIVLMGSSGLKGLGQHVLGQLALTGAAASYALAAVYGRRLAKTTPLVLAAGQMFTATAFVLPLCLYFERPWTLSPAPQAVFSVVVLALTSTALANVMYYDLLAGLGATRLSLVTYIIPLSGVFWGWLVLGERLHWTAFAAMGIILSGVALLNEKLPDTRQVEGQ